MLRIAPRTIVLAIVLRRFTCLKKCVMIGCSDGSGSRTLGLKPQSIPLCIGLDLTER